MQAGEVLHNRFQVERFVARGGMGDVYRATDRQTHRPVALKVLTFDDDAMAARLAREAGALIELSHPAVVRHVAHATTGRGQLYLAMEWLEGLTLSQRIRERRLSIEETLAMSIRLAEGLGAAHARGMVHRDVKPSNVLVVDNDVRRVKLLDFGIVRMASWRQITETGVGMGTPEYMAPEQARCEQVIAPSADIFALGCVMYKCLLGRGAFSGKHVDAVLAKIAVFDSPPRLSDEWPEVPVIIDDLVAEMMAYNPAERPANGAKAAQRIRVARGQLRSGVVMTKEVELFPSITTHEVEPVAVILADPGAQGQDLGDSDTAPSDVITLERIVASAQLAEGHAPTVEHSMEGVRVMRGPANAAAVLAAMRRALDPFGARIEVLANGSFVVLLSGGIAATDLAIRAARCALTLQREVPRASIGLATTQAARGGLSAIGPVIDIAASMVRPGSRQLFVDAATHDLLPQRFKRVVALEPDESRSARQGSGNPVAPGALGTAESARHASEPGRPASGAQTPGRSTTAPFRRVSTSVTARVSYRLLGEEQRGREGLDDARLLLGKQTTCVGRGALLGQLAAAFDGCFEDETAHAAVVIGDAGVGKSRFRAELMSQVFHRHGEMRVLAAYGDEPRAQVPYSLLSRALRQYFDLGDGDSPSQQAQLRSGVASSVVEGEQRRVAEFLGEIIGLRFDATESPPLRASRKDPQLMADHKLRAWHDWLRAESAASPMAVVIDDLQWGDSISVDLIGSGLAKAADRGLMVLALGRPGLRQQYPTLVSDWSCQEIPLAPLRPKACEQLIREMLGPAVGPEVMHKLIERSEGNAFYLEELIRAAARGDVDVLPQTVIASAQMRIGLLNSEARHIMRGASVFGRVFWAGGVASLLHRDFSRPEIEDWLATLEDSEFVQRRESTGSLADQGEYAFRHDLLRQAAYEMLTDEDRVVGHRLAGQWLQEHDGAEPLVLAEHFAGGGVADKAVEWFEKAAELALRPSASPDSDGDMLASLAKAAAMYDRAGQTAADAYANESSINSFERAAALWGVTDKVQAAHTRIELADVHTRLGQRDIALAVLSRAEDDAGDADPALIVEALIRRAKLEVRNEQEGALERAETLARRANSLAMDLGDSFLDAGAASTLAHVLSQYETEEASALAIRYAERSLSLMQGQHGVGHSAFVLATQFLRANQLDRATSLYNRALLLATAESDDNLIAMCLGNMGMVEFRAWRLDEAIESTRRSLSISERIGDRIGAAETKLNLGTFLSFLEDSHEARDLLQSVMNGGYGNWVLTTQAQEMLAEIERHAGNERRAQGLLADAATVCATVGLPQKQAFYLGLRAESLWSTGDLAAAITSLEESVRVGEGVTLSQALLTVRIGLFEQAQVWLERLAEVEPEPDRRVVAKLTSARLFAWGDRVGKAQSLCEDALGLLEATDAPRYTLPAKLLMASFTCPSDALDYLAEIETCCGPHIVAEAYLDVATALARNPKSNAESIQKFLRVSANPTDLGVRFQILRLRSRLFGRLGLVDEAEAEGNNAKRATHELRAALPPHYVPTFDSHPWLND